MSSASHVLFTLVTVAMLIVQGLGTASGAPTATGTAELANIFFEDGFEAASLDPAWSSQTGGNGVVELTTDYERSGNQGAFLGQKASGSAFAALILSFDLSGETDVFLDFWARTTGFGEARRLSLSDNGGASWTEIRSLDSIARNHGHFVIDLADVAGSTGLALNNQFRVRFSYSSSASGGDAADGFAVDDVRLSRRAQVVAGFPFAQESFESGVFVQGLYPQAFSNGVVEITSDYPRSGSRSVFLGQQASGSASASLVMALDLTGQTDVFLNLWGRSTGSDEVRRISISDNSGASWIEISNLDALSSSFSHLVIDLADAAAGKGLALNSRFRISFAYSSSANGGNAGDGFVIDDIRLTQRAQAVADLSATLDSFEGGSFAKGLYPRSFNRGTARITNDYPRSGASSVFLGQEASGEASASLILALDLSSQTSVYLDFLARSTGSAENRRVSISDNGGASWTEIRDLDALPQGFRWIVVDIAEAARTNGRALNAQFRIALTYSSSPNGGDTGDGFVIDDLRISNTNPVSKAYLPGVRR